jgi:hypothetical protein
MPSTGGAVCADSKLLTHSNNNAMTRFANMVNLPVPLTHRCCDASPALRAGPP